MRLKLTNETIRTKCLPPEPNETTKTGRPLLQRLYLDTELPGFGVMVGRRSKTFIAQRDRAGQTKRRKVGRFPTWTVEQARKRAREVMVMIDKGEDPLVEARAKVKQEIRQAWQRYTLAEAIEEHVKNMKAKACAPGTIVQLRRELDRHAGAWMQTPLASLTRATCIALHRKITSANGPYVANRVVRELRSVWNSARKLHEELPTHPFSSVTMNKEIRRREPVTDLVSWAQKVNGLSNHVRRDLQWFFLLTASRRTASCMLRWENVDFKAGTVHFPKPKGGEDKAFTIPLCRYLLDMLAKRKEENLMISPGGDNGWVFVSFDIKGIVAPVAEPKEHKYQDQADGSVKKVAYLPGPHRLRDTWLSAAHEVGIDFFTEKVLVNHALPTGDVTHGYIRPNVEHLRLSVERVAEFLLMKAEAASPWPRK